MYLGGCLKARFVLNISMHGGHTNPTRFIDNGAHVCLYERKSEEYASLWERILRGTTYRMCSPMFTSSSELTRKRINLGDNHVDLNNIVILYQQNYAIYRGVFFPVRRRSILRHLYGFNKYIIP